MTAMNRTALIFTAVGLGAITAGQYVLSPWLHGDGPDAPPAAALLSMSSLSISSGTVDAITDFEYPRSTPRGPTITTA
jgi:hypothetical protein